MDWELGISGYIAPATLSAAVRYLAESSTQEYPPLVWAGGTDLMPRMRMRWLDSPEQRGLQSLLSLRSVSELSGIEVVGDMLRIGSLTTIEEMRRSPLISAHAPALAIACDLFASFQIRHAATLGGNLVNASPAADTAGPLLVHQAVVVCAGWRDGSVDERHIPLAEFWLGPGRCALAADELLVAVELPIFPDSGWVAYEKHCRRPAKDISIVSITLAVEPDGDGGLCRSSLALGAVAPTPLLVPQVAELLAEGGFGSKEGHSRASRMAAEAASPIDDVRGSAAHRRHLVEVLTHRALDGIAARMGYSDFNGYEPPQRMTITQSGSALTNCELPPMTPQPSAELQEGDIEVNFTLNGGPMRRNIAAGATLVALLREDENLTGTKIACEEGECGACSVLLDGRAVQSCLTLAVECEGREVVTVEGVYAPDGELHDLMEDMLIEGGVQCGFCSPGMVISGLSHFLNGGGGGEQELARAIEGNLCRCTGYLRLLSGLERHAARLGGGVGLE